MRAAMVHFCINYLLPHKKLFAKLTPQKNKKKRSSIFCGSGIQDCLDRRFVCKVAHDAAVKLSVGAIVSSEGLMGNNSLPISSKWLLVGLRSLQEVGLSGAIPHWLLARSTLSTSSHGPLHSRAFTQQLASSEQGVRETE